MQTPKAPQLQSNTNQDSTKDKLCRSPNKSNSETFKKFSTTVPSKTKQPKQTTFDSSGTVYRPEAHGFGVWGNRRVVMSIRIDAKLKKRFKQYLIAKFGSTCRGIESIAVALLKAEQIQQDITVYRKPTVNINFEKVLIERNLRPRRKLVPKEEIEETTEIRKIKKTKRRLVLDDIPDYSKYSLEKLDKLHRMYQNLGDVGKSALVFTELKRRGVVL